MNNMTTLIFLVFIWLIWMAMVVRTKLVADYRMRLLDEKLRIDNEMFWENHEYYKTVSFDEMVWKFWRPIKSFYDETKWK